MAIPLASRDERETAAENGRICALAIDCLSDLRDCAATYPELFPPRPFDPTTFSGIALANAFSSPWAPAEQLRITARTILWAFAVDWLIDYTARSPEEVDAIVQGCVAVGQGTEPVEEVALQRLLASIRAELSSSRTWPALYPAWRDSLERYLVANAREWRWKAAHAAGAGRSLPTFAEYLANADNLGSSFVNVSHWIAGGNIETPDQLQPFLVAGEESQRALRLINDLATYERDVEWGDLNSLMLGVGRAEVSRRVDELVESCDRLITPLTADHPREAVYLRRQLGYSVGYYGVTDYWGAL
jgi:hypothetical protein